MKRGTSGLSLVVGVDKPSGMSSHDVVNRCRSIFGEKRIGHTGTLDPLATGVLPICVGPATRLGTYLTGHDKHYRVTIVFGAGTDTDDAQGQIIRTGDVPSCVFSRDFAEHFVDGLIGRHKQMPPVYSAIKVNGKKSYEAARSGKIIDLAPRDIEIYEARLVAVVDDESLKHPAWIVDFHVSKGTYIRAIARDIGVSLACPAHVAALQRTKLGSLTVKDCISLETLADLKQQAALDPVSLLDRRILFVRDSLINRVINGSSLRASECTLYSLASTNFCSCSSGVREDFRPSTDGEVVSVVADNKLVALYSYHEKQDEFRPCCVFQVGVIRG